MFNQYLQRRLSERLRQISPTLTVAPLSVSGAKGSPPILCGHKLIWPLPEFDCQLSCPDDLPGAHALLQLSAMLAAELRDAELRQPPDPRRLWLEGVEKPSSSVADLCCVLALRVPQAGQLPLLQQIIPLEKDELLVEMSDTVAALVRSGGEGIDELIEYALALQESLLEEENLSLTIGVSKINQGGGALALGWEQAQQALSLGSRFHPDQSVHLWHRLTVDRLLAEIPPEKVQRYTDELFTKATLRLFNEEMLQTIKTFIDKDLSLSDTARQLYIHRNTLVYRLDKVQKVTGLDLRRFDDAMTFQLLYTLRRCGENDTGRNAP